MKQIPVILMMAVILVACSNNQNNLIGSETYEGGATASPSSTFIELPTNSDMVIIGEEVVRGSLCVQSDESCIPLKYVIIYLARILDDTSGKDSIAALDRIRSPRAITDDDGGFEFIDMPTGRYSLILDTVQEAYLLHDPVNGYPLVVEIREGLGIDLGNLKYDSLPVRIETPEK